MQRLIRTIGAISAILGFLVAAFVVSGVTGGIAAAADPSARDVKLDGGYQELVISVADLEATVAFYQKVAGWRVIHRGAVQPEMLEAWGLPDSAKATEAVLQNAGDAGGFVRLIKFRGIPQDEVRPSGRLWDTGGLAGMIVRVRDVVAKYNQFRANGWHAFSQPITTKNDRETAIETVMQGSADECIAMRQVIDPPIEVANLKELGYPARSFAAVKDIDATVAFYTDKLGFKVVRRDQGPAAPPGRNVYGLPANLVGNVYRRSATVHPQGDDPKNPHTGALILTTLYGADGEDFAARAKPPNLGLIVVRFAVSDAAAKAADLKAKGVTLEYEPAEVGIAPYGGTTVFAVRDPNGTWIEFFEPDDKP